MTILLTGHTAVDVIRNNMAARQTDLRLYLDVIPDPSKVHLTVYDFTLSHTLCVAGASSRNYHGFFEAFRYIKADASWHWQMLCSAEC
jgi:hypothetical protein